MGIDGSPSSLQALRWAAHEAELRQANLKVVHAVQLYVSRLGLPTSPRVFSPDVRYPADLLAAGRKLLDGEIAQLGRAEQRSGGQQRTGPLPSGKWHWSRRASKPNSWYLGAGDAGSCRA